jgi:uncharacterized membrane protein (UPF0136 family)
VKCYCCKTCDQPFESKVTRTFCSVKCRASDPELKAQLLRNLAAPNSRNGPARSGDAMPCVKCGAELYLTATDRKRGKKACSRSCWRAWLAERFDRHIGAINSVNEMRGFDEYLSQSKLSCLFEGCNWSGDDLGLHANIAHGVSAKELKLRAGFNVSTGLISASLARLYDARNNKGMPATLNRVAALSAHPMKAQRISSEAREHYDKSRAIAKITQATCEAAP